MGTTATYFCDRGHIVSEIPNYEFNKRKPKSCWCGSHNLAVQFEFGNPELPQLVSSKWLYYGWHWDNRKQKMIKFYVYDVTKLFVPKYIVECNIKKNWEKEDIVKIHEIVNGLVPNKIIIK